MNLEKNISSFYCSGIDSRVSIPCKNLTKINVHYETEDIAMKQTTFINKKYGDDLNTYYIKNNTIEMISNKTNKESQYNG